MGLSVSFSIKHDHGQSFKWVQLLVDQSLSVKHGQTSFLEGLSLRIKIRFGSMAVLILQQPLLLNVVL